MGETKQEHVRINRWVERYGVDVAKAKVQELVARYRKAVICDCDMYQHRDSLIRSYAAFKAFLRTGETEYEPEASEAYSAFCEKHGFTPRYKRVQASNEETEEGSSEDAQ